MKVNYYKRLILLYSSSGKKKILVGLKKQSYALLLLQITSFKNNLSEYTEDEFAARYFLAKLKRCGYFIFFKFNKFRLYPFQFLHLNFLYQKSSLFKFQLLQQ